MCCHEFLARLLLGKDHGQGKAVSFARVYEQAVEGPSGPQTAYDWYTVRAEQVWQDSGAYQHDPGAVQGLLRADHDFQPQYHGRRWLVPRQEVHRGDDEGAGGPGADLLRGVGRTGTAPDYSPAAQDHRDQQAAEDAIPLPDFDRYRRFRRQSAPAQAIGRQRAGHAVCARKALPDQHSCEHTKAAPRKQRRARQQRILLHLEAEEPAGEGQPAGGADGAGAEAPA